LTLSGRDVVRARKALRKAAFRTPLTRSRGLSEAVGAEVFLKWETLQHTGCFKFRGAYHKISSLRPQERERGLMTASAGNHGLAVAYVGRMMRAKTTIVVPTSAPRVKVEGCQRLGAEVIVEGAYYDESVTHCLRLASQTGATYIPATEDEQVIAGQGTVGCEILEDMPDVQTVIVPVGGGGLISGMAIWIKSVDATIRVLGVQSTAARTMHDSFRAGKVMEVPYVPTLADGLAGGVTQMKLDLVLKYVDDIVLAPEEKLKPSILWLLKEEGQLVEGAGIVGPAALLEGKVSVQPGERVAVVISGGNVDRDVLGIAAPPS
jgi:threonine dehydratase